MLLRQRDEDRWLSAKYAEARDERRLYALYALHSEIKRIPAVVSEPQLGEIRLQWFRDAFEEIRAGAPVRQHPVIEEVAATGLAQAEYADAIEEAINAGARPLYDRTFTDACDLFEWLEKADGAIDALAARFCGGGADIVAAAQSAGAAFAAARFLPHLPAAMVPEVKMRALEIWHHERETLRKAPTACAPALAHLYLTPAYAKRAGRAFPVLKRALLFRAVATAH